MLGFLFEKLTSYRSMQKEGKTQRSIEIISIINDQLELWRLSSYVATQEPAIYKGEELTTYFSDAKTRTTQMIAMGAAQSVNTLLSCSSWEGIPVRDLYPIARSCVESFINSAYLIAEDDSVAERAVRWVAFRSWKHANLGGKHTIRRVIKNQPPPIPPKFAEFKNFKESDWSPLKVPERAERVLEIAGNRPGSRLLGAYDLIYPISSEVIHGSPFGINYFYQLYSPPNATTEDTIKAIGRQYEDILIAVSHALAGYLSTFFWTCKMALPYAEEQFHFNRLLKMEGINPQALHFITKEEKQEAIKNTPQNNLYVHEKIKPSNK